MAAGPDVSRFGPYEFHSDRRCLFRDGHPIILTIRQSDTLTTLVSNAGRVLTQFQLTDMAWQGAAVTPNSVVQIVNQLRALLGTQADGTPYIETRHGKGYCFAAPVTRGRALQRVEEIDEPVEPQRVLVDGRACVETLDLTLLPSARERFEKGRILTPGLAAPYIGLAMVDALTYESRRVDLDRNPALLESAFQHATDACVREPANGEARIARAFIRYLRGEVREAIAEARHGVTLEPNQCLHELRRTQVSWGDVRLRAGDLTLKLHPNLGPAYLFNAQVYIARGAFDLALQCLEAGFAAQGARRVRDERIAAVGLYLLYGLVLMALGRVGDALEAFAHERALEGGCHVYARECAAHLRYAAGIAHRRQGRHADADALLEDGLAIVPGHPMLLVALGEMPSMPPAPKLPDGNNIDVALVTAAIFTRAGKPEAGARVCESALARVGPGCAGWMLPIEPSIHAAARRDVWGAVLARLADRAV